MVSVSEHDRAVLQGSLSNVLGEEGTDILMGLLPLDGSVDVARREDVAALRGDLDGLGRSLRGDMQALEGRLHQEIESLGATLRLEMQAGDARLAVGFHRDMVRQTWILAGTVVAAMSALGAVLH
jgi:hypothetical protein